MNIDGTSFLVGQHSVRVIGFLHEPVVCGRRGIDVLPCGRCGCDQDGWRGITEKKMFGGITGQVRKRIGQAAVVKMLTLQR